jgi:hypothetical protein
MNIQLTWDLFIIVFFIVIIAYSFIVGKNQTLKIIISSYIAILAADGLGNLVSKYLISRDPLIKIFSTSGGEQALVILKIGIFVSTIVLLATRGAFSINMSREKSNFIAMVMTATFAIFSAGLIVSTILIYVSGISLVEGSFNLNNMAVVEIYHNSYFVRSMIDNYSLWFSLPAVGFIFTSFVNTEE